MAQDSDLPELNARILRPLLWYTQEQLGVEAAHEVHRKARVPVEIFQQDSGWLSHEAFERLIAAYRAALGTTERFAKACVYDNRRAYGPLLVVFPFLTGRQAYEVLGRTLSLVSRISRYEVEVRSDRELTLRYFSQRAESRLMCLTRRAQLPTLPMLVGLPCAQVEERSCIATGDACCTYRVRIRAQNRWASPVVGTGLGVLLALATPLRMMPPSVALWLCPVVGLGLGALTDLGRRFIAQRKLLLEARRQTELGSTRALHGHNTLPESGSGTPPSPVAHPARVNRDAPTRTRAAGGPSSQSLTRARERTMPEAGVEVDRYEILGRAGKGGMGTVFTARDTKLGRRVALKLLHLDRQPDDVVLARLVREGQALAALAHPNVVTVYDVGEWEDTLFLVMEFVEGATLKEWTSNRPNAELGAALDLLLQAAEGLAAAHGAGLIHRDFKPSNVLIGDDGRVRVADFGLARRAATDDHRHDLEARSGDSPRRFPDDPLPETSHSNVTKTGQVAGTPQYMAPEQHEGRRLDPRCDQFSFCVVAYEVLCGVHPFAEHSNQDFYAAARASARSAPRRDVPQALLDALSRGMAPSRPRRFGSMLDLVTALRGAAQDRGQQPRPGLFRWMTR
ncbi:MAG: serine/threonine-protein kinase [Nannocystales bacterium]